MASHVSGCLCRPLGAPLCVLHPRLLSGHLSVPVSACPPGRHGGRMRGVFSVREHRPPLPSGEVISPQGHWREPVAIVTGACPGCAMCPWPQRALSRWRALPVCLPGPVQCRPFMGAVARESGARTSGEPPRRVPPCRLPPGSLVPTPGGLGLMLRSAHCLQREGLRTVVRGTLKGSSSWGHGAIVNSEVSV